MGLQIRVKHALGERVIELPDRTVEQPLVVGRSTSADVQVPSVTVAARHCALFIHEGRWVVQDLGAGGTSVNGQPVDEPVLLQIGDAITVGTDALAPTIEVDPAAAAEGRTGYAGTGLSAGSPPPSSGYGVPGYTGGYAGSGGYGGGGGFGGGYGNIGGVRPPMAVAPAPVAVAVNDAPEPALEANTDLSAAAASAPSYRRRRKDGSVATQIAVIAICFVMITGLVALVIWKVKETNDNAKAQANQPVVIIQREAPTTRYIRATPTPPTTATGPKPVFIGATPPRKPGGKTPPGGDDTDDTEPAKPTGNAPKPKPANPATPTTPGAEEGMDPRPPRQGTPASPVKPGGTEEGMGPIRRPTTAPSAEEGMDPIRRPTTPGDATMGGGTDGGGMDMVRKPTTAPAAPPPRDAENISAAEATKWEVMKELAGMTGKESFAVWRFEEFKRTNSSKAAEIDQMVERKLDTIWWERIDQLFARVERLDALRRDIKLNKLPDVNDPKEKESLIKAFNQADTDMKAARKTLTDIMGYKEPKPPSKDEAALESARQARVQSLYNNWKLITVKAIVQNQGKLPWAGEN